MQLNYDFDFKKPNYTEVYRRRIKLVNYINNLNNYDFNILKNQYFNNIHLFINDFGFTFDPRNIAYKRDTYIPFLLMPKQIETIQSFFNHFMNKQDLLVEKSRAVGMSWLSIAFACSLCLLQDGVVVGFGSRKQEYVDVSNNLNALLPKARMFLKMLPQRFLGGMNVDRETPFMRLIFRNGSQIIGESGDGIGRGARASLYFIDEAAFLERPQLTEASLSATTDCRIYISTPNGLGNPFAQKRFSGKHDVLTFHWRDDARLDEEWYQKKKQELDSVVLAQEIDINYNASVEGVVIPSEWIQSAINSHLKLNIEVTGALCGALDVADEGKDKNAIAIRKGILLQHIEQWSGQNSDIGYTTQKAVQICDNYEVLDLKYDADGVGAGVKGFMRQINENKHQRFKINVEAFHGSSAVLNPNTKEYGEKYNKDFFANKKAQMWWKLRKLFENTHNAVTKGDSFNQDEIISISSDISLLNQLTMELCQPTYNISTAGKILIDKTPDGVKSPNLADAVMMCYARSSFIDIMLQDW